MSSPRLTLWWMAASLLAAALAGCAGSTITRRTEVTEYGERKEASATSTTIHTNREAAALERARDDHRAGRYAEAAAGFQRVYDNAEAKPEFREQALYELARLAADLLNPGKDRVRAAELFRRFLAEFPASRRADEAREQLAGLEAASGK